MRIINRTVRARNFVWAACALGLVLAGCSTPEQYYALGAGVVAVGAGMSPANEIEQIYYLGIFDPREQVPPAVYRIRVRGQSSAYNATKFASGWVRAELIDSLGARVELNQAGGVTSTAGANAWVPFSSEANRRLVLFGPEGFREAPKDHRLVIVMGASPDKFFNALDQSLGVVSEAVTGRQSAALAQSLARALILARNERERLDVLAEDIETGVTPRKEVD